MRKIMLLVLAMVLVGCMPPVKTGPVTQYERDEYQCKMEVAPRIAAQHIRDDLSRVILSNQYMKECMRMKGY